MNNRWIILSSEQSYKSYVIVIYDSIVVLIFIYYGSGVVNYDSRAFIRLATDFLIRYYFNVYYCLLADCQKEYLPRYCDCYSFHSSLE